MTPILDMGLHEINRALRPTDACDATFGDGPAVSEGEIRAAQDTLNEYVEAVHVGEDTYDGNVDAKHALNVIRAALPTTPEDGV